MAGVARKPKAGDTNEVSAITITFRALSRQSVSSDANNTTAFAVRNELKNDPMFDADGTDFLGELSKDEPPGTFTFKMTVALKKPLKL
jgi:hypothetical protein